MTADEARTLQVGDWVAFTGEVYTLGTVAGVHENGAVITWETSAGSQFVNFDSFQKIDLVALVTWYQPIHYMNSAGAGWRIVSEPVRKEFATYLLLASGRYVRKQDKGQFPYFRTYDQAAKRMVELLNVSQAKAMARFLRAQDAGEALIERLNAEAPDVS